MKGMKLIWNMMVISLLAAMLVADTPWPMFHHDFNHTGRSPYLGAQTGVEKWNFATGKWIFWSSPAIDSDGTIYVGSRDHKLYAINPNGTEKWSFNTDHDIYSSPAICSDGTIYMGSRIGNLYVINPDGTGKWSFEVGETFSSPTIDLDGTIYIGSADNKLYAINPDGTEKWNFTTGSDVPSSPSIGADGTIYVGSQDNKLYAVNPDGTEKWSFATGNTVFSSPAIGSDGTIYVGSHGGNLYAINPDGIEKWSFTTGDIILSSPAISPDGTIYVGSKDHNLYAIGGISKIVFTTPARTIKAGRPSEIITIQTQDSAGNPHPCGIDFTVNLSSSSTTGSFSLTEDPWVEVTSVTIPAGSNSVSLYYKDTTLGNPTITASEYPDRAWADGTQQETVTSSAFWYLSMTARTKTAGLSHLRIVLHGQSQNCRLLFICDWVGAIGGVRKS